MNKFFIGISIFGVFVFIGYLTQPSVDSSKDLLKAELKTNDYFKEALAKKVQGQIQGQSPVGTSPSQNQGGQGTSPAAAPVEDILLSQSGTLLFQYLFEGPFMGNEGLSELSLQNIRKRFAQALSVRRHAHDLNLDRELTSRVGILKALQMRPWTMSQAQEKEATSRLLKELLAKPGQPWAIQRQALRSLVSINTEATESEKARRLKGLDSRVIASAALSDHDVLEVLFAK